MKLVMWQILGGFTFASSFQWNHKSFDSRQTTESVTSVATVAKTKVAVVKSRVNNLFLSAFA